MSYFKLQPNGVDNAVPAYGGLGNLRRIMARNDDNFEDYINLGNRPLPNQNALVTFLQLFSVNVEWTPDYLINIIDIKAQSLASTVGFVGLYNKGRNFLGTIYPETNHNTLIVVPFGKPSRLQIDSYFTRELNSLVPFFPIYTTDYKQRWDITELTDSQTYKAPKPLYTIVQIDVYALVIGFYRWLKLGLEWGNSPHGYLNNFPMMNHFLHHNELVNFNYLNGNGEKFDLGKGSFALEPYMTQLKDYTDFKHRYLMTESMKSFTQFMKVNEPTNVAVNSNLMVFPEAYKSLMFTQMNWVWTIGSLAMVDKYVTYNRLLGTVDGVIDTQLKMYYKYSLQSQLNQIKDNTWSDHFELIHAKMKEKV